MKTLILAFLLLFSVAAGASELSDSCLDCHDLAFDFEGCDTAEMVELITARSIDAPKHKATLGLTAEQIQELAEYIAVLANPAE